MWCRDDRSGEGTRQTACDLVAQNVTKMSEIYELICVTKGPLERWEIITPKESQELQTQNSTAVLT